MKSRILFDHIYKAAGSSINRVLVDHFGQDNVTFGLIEPLDNALTRYAHQRVITGHFTFVPGQRFDPTRYTFTVLRHPIDRLLSHYHFCRSQVPMRGGNSAVQLAKTLSLEDYVLCDVPEVQSLLQNGQTTHFMPIKWDGVRATSASDKLAAAKAALDEYDLVGVLDELEDFVQVLCIETGMPPPNRMPRANVTVNRASINEVDASIRRRLEEMNLLDMELHEHALTLFRSKRRMLLRQCASSPHARGTMEDASGGAETPCRDDNNARATRPVPVGLPAANFGNRRVEIIRASVVGDVSQEHTVFSGELITVNFVIRAQKPTHDVVVGIRITDRSGRIVFGTNCRSQGQILNIRSPGDCHVAFRFRCDLGYGDYAVTGALHPPSTEMGDVYHWRDQLAWISVVGNLGDHWEGEYKLYPQITCAPAAEAPHSAVELERFDAGRDPAQHLADHARLLQDFRGVVEPVAAFTTMRPSEIRAVEMRVRHLGGERWPATGRQRVCASYHWFREDGSRAVHDGERTELPRDLEPGETVRLWMTVKAPDVPGPYRLRLTLVQEYHAWFDEMGTLATELVVVVATGNATRD